MTAFKYVAVDADGKKIRAKADAVNQDSLRNELEARQLRVTKIARRRRFTEIEITKRRVPREDVMHFSRQVAAFVRAGIPLVEALDTVRETAKAQALSLWEASGTAIAAGTLEARRLLRRLGRDRMMLAPSIETTLDSLGLDTDVVQDPTLPSVVLVLVRNPWRLKMASVGYMLWYRGVDLRMQGVSFPPAVQPVLRSWWTGQPSSPYAAAVLYRQRGTAASQGFKYLRMAPDGYYWELAQYEGNGPDLGDCGDAVFCDANHDGLPELLAYSFAPQDSILRVEGAVQPLLREVLYTERGRAFVAHDARILPGPLATLRLYLSLLRQGNREQAAKLLLQPDVLELTLAAGWAGTRSPREFVVERQEENTAWPEWLGVRVLTRDGVTRRWNVHFMLQEGRWLIQDCIAVGEPPVDTPPSPSPAPTKGHRP